MHGCKEGQCAACKSFVLEGEDIELDRYSTFALPDFEKEEGQTLLCRAHAYEDLVIELLHYDEEIIRSGLPLQKGVVEVVSNEPVTHDMRHLVISSSSRRRSSSSPASTWTSWCPAPRRRRSFSMANTPSREGRFEFVIKIYPDGLFSEFLAKKVQPRRPAGGGGPVRHLHAAGEPHVGPVLPRRRRGHGPDARPAALDGGARGRPRGHLLLRRPPQRDLCFKRARGAGERLPDFRYVPALSEPGRRRLGTASRG